MMQENEQFEEALLRIFNDERKINRVIQDLEELSSLGTEDIQIQVSELAVGLKITLKITANCLKQHGIEFKRFKNDVLIDLILTPDYPFDQPRILFQNTFCYPSLADGRDFFNSVMTHVKWNSSLVLTQVLNELINYLKTLNRRIKDYEFLIKEGQYQIGEEYDMEYFFNLSTCELFASSEIISKKKLNQKILMVTQFKFLEFELIKNSNKTAQLVIVEDLKDLLSFVYPQKSKNKRIQLKWQIPNKKKTRISEYLIDEDEKFLELLTERSAQVEKLVLATKKIISEDDVTIKNYENMDLDQILQNITIIESELSENITLNAIDTLMVLYQNAIQFLSAVADPSYKLFVEKLQDLLTREDVQMVLKSKEKPKNNDKPSSDNKPSSTIPIEDFDSIFEDLSSSQVPSKDSQGKVSENDQKKRKMEELRKAELLKKYFQHRINLQNQDRYIIIQTRYFSKYIEKMYYDKTDKKKIVHVQYKNHNRVDFDSEAQVRQLLITQKENIIPGILEINKSSKEMIYSTGLCTLQQLAEVTQKKGIEWTKQDLLYILKTLLVKLQDLSELKLFISDIKPHNIVTYVKDNYRDFGIEFSVNQQNLCESSKYPITYTKAYIEPQFLKHLQNKEPIADHERIQNELYMVGRTIQYLIDSTEENFKKENVENFINNLSEEKYGSTLKKTLQMLLVEKMVNDFGYIISELNRGEEKIIDHLKDENGYNLVIHENLIKDGLQKSIISDIHLKVLFEQRYQLNEKSTYMVDTIGSDSYPLYPLLLNEKNGTLKEILEKTENLIKENTENAKESKTLYESIIQILQSQNIQKDDTYKLPEMSAISSEESFIFITLLCLKGIIYKWNGYFKLFKSIQQYALEICKKLLGEEHPLYASCLINLAQSESLNSHPENGLKNLIDAYAIRKNILGNHPSTLYTLLSIAESLRKQGKYTQALDIHERVQLDFTELSEKDQHQICLGKLLLSQARTLMLSKKYNESYTLISQSIEIFRESYGEDSFQITEAYSETADLFTFKQQLKDAHQLNVQCIEIVKNLYGDSHPLLADYYVNISYTFRNAKKYDESMNYLIQSMEIRKKFFGENHPIIADTYTEQANTLTYSNQLQQASELHKLALKIREELYGVENTITLSSLEAIVVLLLVQQKFEEASEFQSKVIDGYDQIYGQDSIHLAKFLEKIAYQHEQHKNYNEALPYQQRVLEIRQKAIDQDQNHQYLQSLLNISFSLDQCNQYEESLKYKKEALQRMKIELGDKHKKVTQQLISIAETQINQDLSQDALDSLKEALILIKEKGLEENETTKCLRAMGQILTQQGQKGNTEVVFEFYEKIMAVVGEVLTQQSTYYSFIESICQQTVEQLIQ